MKKIGYYIIIIFLMMLIIFSLYNYTHPIKSLEDEKIIHQGKVTGIGEEYEYNEEAEYIPMYFIYIFDKDSKENVSIKIDKDDIKKYNKGVKVNYYEYKGDYLITDEEKTATKGGIIWIILSIFELCGIIFIIKKLLLFNIFNR